MKRSRDCAVCLRLVTLASFLLAGVLPATPARAQIRPDAVILERAFSGLNNPVYLTSARDGSNRLFVVEQGGRIRVAQPGSSATTIFLDIASKVISGGERGLLGLAFHPQFSTNRRFFVDYTRQPDGATVIAEYQASIADPNVASATETVLLVIPQPFSNHNGGMIEFGPDRFLYIGIGDGGSANDPGNRAQNINDLLGKILRIDVDHPAGGQLYSSPGDNPFFGPTQGRDEIFAYGLRNPWRFSFDRANGQLIAGDVGQNRWEEIDIVTRGGNYGWRVMEGLHCNPAFNGGACTPLGMLPIAEYEHSLGRCSVTGGYVYRGARVTLPVGAYVFGDFCTGEIFMLNGGATTLLMDTGLNIASFGEDEAGEIYVVNLGGTVDRIVNPDEPPPSPELNIRSAMVRKRSNREIRDPLRVKSNGRKFEVVLVGTGYVEDSNIFINGRKLNTHLEQTPVEAAVLVGRLKKNMLAEPGLLLIEFVNPDGARSNQVVLEVVED